MSEVFSADEVFAMAEKIEKNGADFYRKAAQKPNDPRTKELFERLAKWELSHRETFATMRNECAADKDTPLVFDPESEAGIYLKAMADGHVFDTSVDISKFFTGKETMKDIFKTAMKMERDSIIFYLGLKDVVASKAGKDKVDEIIKEEMRHIAFLNREHASFVQ
ncbi:MAG: ferritin family protein [Sedimentisphaerales bacterium]|nr:ferritin family protein [Sedimentisphaerales bacterium]